MSLLPPSLPSTFELRTPIGSCVRTQPSMASAAASPGSISVATGASSAARAGDIVVAAGDGASKGGLVAIAAGRSSGGDGGLLSISAGASLSGVGGARVTWAASQGSVVSAMSVSESTEPPLIIDGVIGDRLHLIFGQTTYKHVLINI